MMDTTPWLAALEARVLGHSLLVHPLLRAFRKRTVTWEQIRVFGLAYYPVVMRIHLFQAQALAITLDSDVQTAFAGIIDLSCGAGDPDFSNCTRYRQFLCRLGYDESDWANPPVVASLRPYALVHRALCSGDPLAAIGVAGMALQWPAPSLYDAVAYGVERFPQVQVTGPALFRTMGQLAVVGSEHAIEATKPLLHTPSARMRLEDGVLASLDAQHVLLDGIWAAMCRASTLRPSPPAQFVA